MSDSWTSKVQYQLDYIDEHAVTLSHLAAACRLVGLTDMADNLGSISEELEYASQEIDRLISEHIKDELKLAQISLGMVISTALDLGEKK